MIDARYTTADRTSAHVSLAEGDALGTMHGPAQFSIALPSPGNAEHDALMALVGSGEAEIRPFAALPASVPAIISDRQFAQALAKQGVISKDEALAFVKRGEVPPALQAVIDSVSDDEERFDLDMAVSGATTFERSNPSTESLAAALGWSSEQMDDLWTYAASIR